MALRIKPNVDLRVAQ